MDDKMRARTYYAAAVSLFQEPTAGDCKRAIELLDEAVDLYPDFSEASIFRAEVWHYLLKSLDGIYKNYLKSPAWKVKRDAVEQRDGGQCVCGAQATEVHHKTYKNIGKELLSDLVALCKECHEREHIPYVPTDQQPSTQLPPNDPSGQAYWDQFKTYVEEKENQLQLFPEPNLPSIYGIQIDKQTLRNEDISKDGAFWLIAFRSQNELQANLCMQSSTHYNHLKEQEDIIFEGNLGELKWQKKKQEKKWVGFVDDTVGHVSRANTEQEFSWLHERLIKLHEVFQPRVLKLQR